MKHVVMRYMSTRIKNLPYGCPGFGDIVHSCLLTYNYGQHYGKPATLHIAPHQYNKMKPQTWKQVMDLFELEEDKNLNLMKNNQSLNYITQEVLNGMRTEFLENIPRLIFVQGDTTTAFAASLAAFYEKIPIAHIEAGLRTCKLLDPYPEEANRRLISQISTLHFAPTEMARNNLACSGIKENVFVTGNTIIDIFQII